MATAPKQARFDPKEIGARVKKARKLRGLSTEKLAEKARIGVDSLYKKQRGEQPFYFEELSRVCEALNAPTLFPFLEWDAARMVDKQLGRDSNGQ